MRSGMTQKTVGVDYGEGTPVPIPNTEVKLTGAENTWSETAREDRLMPTLEEPLSERFFSFSIPS